MVRLFSLQHIAANDQAGVEVKGIIVGCYLLVLDDATDVGEDLQTRLLQLSRVALTLGKLSSNATDQTPLYF